MDQPSRLPTILLVEPDDDNRDMYVEYVTVCGFTPVAVAGGEEAVRRAWQADAIVTALRLRGSCDGIELIQRLRHDEVTKATPIIVLTACVLGADRERALAAGCDAFLPKPCLPETLVAELRRVLSLRRVPKPTPVRAAHRTQTRKRRAS